MEFSVEEVTPELAAEWLELAADKNRRLSKVTMTSYAMQMKEGEWVLTHQGIAFDHLGRLHDGQHRLWAVIESGRPIKMLVARGVDPATFAVLDTGKKRGPADALHIAGLEKYETMIAGGARLLHYYEEAPQKVWTGVSVVSPGGITNATIIEVVEKHPLLVEMASEANLIRHELHLQPSPLLAALTLIREADPDGGSAAEFIEGIRTGVNLRRGDPRLAFRTFAINISTGLGSDRRLSQKILGCTLKAWNAYVMGENVHLLRYVPGREKMPEVVSP